MASLLSRIRRPPVPTPNAGIGCGGRDTRAELDSFDAIPDRLSHTASSPSAYARRVPGSVCTTHASHASSA
ncbi:MAG TPA: hypothetical protein VLJ39_01370, partial [Tepidisphaeraceae bacterium]|nr:hypothetical protein [Tepidisphaeraceae bacterium]